MSAVIPLRLFSPLLRTEQPQIGFVHEIGRLQRVIRSLVAEHAGGQVAQLTVHGRQQLTERGDIAGVPSIQKMRDVTHTWRDLREF